MSRVINAVVIDDSAFMRKSISMMLQSDPLIRVIATARDGKEGVQKVKELRPDIVTLDIEMPVMDGIAALKEIMRDCPTPVLMVSSVTTEGGAATLDALSAGAIDFIAKDRSSVSSQVSTIRDELVAKIRTITGSSVVRLSMQQVRNRRGGRPRAASPVRAVTPPRRTTVGSGVSRSVSELKAVLVGISTGGPFALLQMVPALHESFPLPIAIVQHMPPHFTGSLADRLNAMSRLNVREAKEGDEMKAGTVLIAPGGKHLVFQRRGEIITARITTEPATSLYKPSVDVTMLSALETYRAGLLGVIMTGMGKDGLEGLRAIRRQDGVILAQDEASCVVYGMPKAAVDAGIADAVVPLEEIAGTMMQIVSGIFTVAA